MSKARRNKFSFFILAILLLVSSSFVFNKRAFAYDTKVAHPNIADLAVEVFNQAYPNQKLTSEEAGWIRQGAIDEDTPTRWLNHFYDPIYKKGIWFAGHQQLSAKDWYNNAFTQKMFALGDYSWDRALSDFQSGSKEQAFKGLGHLIHLLSDMTVPAHTRDDIHVVGDSYEQFLKNNWQTAAKVLPPPQFSSVADLNRAFDELANYSNNNFYSDDTIESGRYGLVKVKDYEPDSSGNFAFAKSADGLYLYAVNTKNKDWKGDIDVNNERKKFLTDSHIMLSYGDRLLPRAISSSAGAIKLFLDEAGKTSTIGSSQNRVGMLGYVDRALGSAISAGEGVWNYAKSKLGAERKTASAGESPIITQDSNDTIQQNTASDIRDTTQSKISNFQFPISPANGIPSSQRDKQIQNPNVQKVEEIIVDTVEPQVVVEVPKPVVPPAPAKTTSTPPVYYGGGGGGGGSSGGGGGISNTNNQVPNNNQTSTPDTVTTTLDTTTSTIETPTSTAPCTDEACLVSTTTTPPIIETPTTTPTTTEFATTTLPAVVFNEIAWMGTGASQTQTADEWLELYNNTDADIDLTDWRILVSGKQMNWNKVNPIISAHGYYLLERTDDNALPNVAADGIFTVSGGLNNNGEVLELMDNASTTIDVVSSASWFAGKIDGWKYRTMMKIDSAASSSLAENWQTSDWISPKAAAGMIYGSPKLPNFGFALLKGDLSTYYPHLIASSTIRLTKANSPYLIDYQTKIPSGLTVVVDPGTVLVGIDKTSFFDIFGELQLNGTAEEPIIITSALDSNYFDKPDITNLTGTPAPGDWSRIQINAGGKLTANNTKFLYGGRKFFIPGGFVFGGHNISQVIRNVGGEVQINNAEFFHSYLETNVNDQLYNAVVWSEAPGAPTASDATTTIQGSIFDTGWTAVNLAGQNNGQKIFASLIGNTFRNFSDPDGVIVSTFANSTLSGNTFINNVSSYINLGSWTLNQDAVLGVETDYLFTSITVPAGLTLTISPGAVLTMNGGDIVVNGSLQALGTAESSITVQPKGIKWGQIIFNNSNSNLSNVNLTHGSAGGSYNKGFVTADSSVLNFNGVNFTDAYRPYNMLYLANSTTTIQNSNITWSTLFSSGLVIDGIKISGGNLILDNVNFNQMGIGIEVSGGGALQMNNMGPANFQNIKYYNWWPI